MSSGRALLSRFYIAILAQQHLKNGDDRTVTFRPMATHFNKLDIRSGATGEVSVCYGATDSTDRYWPT